MPSPYELTPFEAFGSRSCKKQWFDEKGRVELETSFGAEKGFKFGFLYLGAFGLQDEVDPEAALHRRGWQFQGDLTEKLAAALKTYKDATSRCGRGSVLDADLHRSDDRVYARAGRELRDAITEALGLASPTKQGGS